MAKLMGDLCRSRCPACCCAAGADCSSAGRGRGAQRSYEKRFWRRDQEDDNSVIAVYNSKDIDEKEAT